MVYKSLALACVHIRIDAMAIYVLQYSIMTLMRFPVQLNNALLPT